MEIFTLIAERPLIWGLFLAYMVLTSILAWIGHKKTGDLSSFALGAGDMHPAIVGVTLAASIASTATFVINPGFVYVHGLSALMHLGVAAGAGVIVALLVLGLGFRRIGAAGGALTLPSWVQGRFSNSRLLGSFFALSNLLALMFVVLIVGGLAIVMRSTLGLSHLQSTLLIIIFVFSYIFVGGTYAHAYTNTLQGVIMAIIAVIIVASGLPLLFEGDVLTKLSAIDPNLAMVHNPASSLFGSFFSVWVAGFLIGFAVVCQPHILIKALYVDSDRQLMRSLGVALLVSLAFSSLLLVGLYAHLMELPREAFLDPVTGAFRQDLVMTIYITKTFSPGLLAVITVALISAGMSTLDGLLIALSSIAANDLFLPLGKRTILKDRSEEDQGKIAHRAGQLVLIAMGLATFLLVYPEPPELLGIFGQLGVYAIVAASVVPITVGVFLPKLRDPRPMLASAILAMLTHFGLYLWASQSAKAGVDLRETLAEVGPLHYLFDHALPHAGLLNPAVTATYGIFAATLTCALYLAANALYTRRRQTNPNPSEATP